MQHNFGKKFSMILILTVAMTLIATIVLGVVLLLPKDVAYGASTIEFLISTTDGETWTLSYKGGEMIDTQTGDWMSTYQKPNQVDALFKAKISSLTNNLDDEFTIEFDLPSITAELSGDTQNPYTQEEDSQIFVDGKYATLIGGVSKTSLEYRLKDSEDEFLPYESVVPISNSIRFGKDVAIGVYEVKFVIVESFNYLDVEYNLTRKSGNVVECSITASNPVLPSVDLTNRTIIYGETLLDVAFQMSNEDGTWSVSSSQNASLVPTASVEPQTFLFDYTDANPNYNVMTNVEIEIVVNPRDIELKMGDVEIVDGQTRVGVQSFDDYDRPDDSLFVGDDTFETLNVEFYVVNVNQEVDVQTVPAGTYIIKARTQNTNYNLVCRNKYKDIVLGGRYFIFPTTVTSTFDGIQIAVSKEDGFEHIRVVITEHTPTYSLDGKVVAGGYLVKFLYDANDNPIAVEDALTLALGGVMGDVSMIAISQDGASFESYQTSAFPLNLGEKEGRSQIEIILFEDEPVTPPTPPVEPDIPTEPDAPTLEQGLEWYHVLLITLSVATLVAIVGVVIAYNKRRWLFK